MHEVSFVLIHRCGAASDFHRVPFSAPGLTTSGTSTYRHILWCMASVNLYLVYFVLGLWPDDRSWAAFEPIHFERLLLSTASHLHQIVWGAGAFRKMGAPGPGCRYKRPAEDP